MLGETNFQTRKFPCSGLKEKNGEKKREKKRGGLNDGDNNGQATHGARKHAWRTQAAWAKMLTFLFIVLFIKELSKADKMAEPSTVG